MNDELRFLDETLGRALEGHGTPDAVDAALSAGHDEQLWNALTSMGVTRLSVPESHGGVGGGLREAAVLLRAIGMSTAAVPAADTLLAGWALMDAEAQVPSGRLTTARAPVKTAASGGLFQVPRVPWASVADYVVLLVASPQPAVVLLAAADLELASATNLAGEPADTVLVGPAAMEAHATPVPTEAAGAHELRGALARSLQLTGAAQRALASTIRHIGEREQFGRPIGRFQAVQQRTAELAAEVATMVAVTDAAVAVAEHEGFASARTRFAVAAAKSRTSTAAQAVTAAAHQMHGAIGFTREHALRLATMRLWAWRDEYGSETRWNAELTRSAFTTPASPWELLTAVR